MIIVIGKTCSGKDTIVNKLVNDYGYNKIITYTTRPMRDNEQQDVTYHFISEKEFLKMADNEAFAEARVYTTKLGVWYYGTALEDLERADDNSIIILSPEGCQHVLNKLKTKPTVVYVYAKINILFDRLKNRGDNHGEAMRRMSSDNIDFEYASSMADYIVDNSDNVPIDQLISSMKIYKKGINKFYRYR